MAQIYQKADEVSIWLGESIGERLPPPWSGCETSKVTLDFINAVAEHGKEMVTKDHAREWFCFISLMKRPWFSRRWVLQELAFAQNPVMYCGNHGIRWVVFKSAIQVFIDHFDAILDVTWWSERDYDRYEVEWANPLEAIPLAAFMESAFEKDTHEPAFSLEALVASMAVFQTSDPRDVVYALLSVAKDRLVEPDYTANVFQIYANFTEKVISASGSLDIICRRWAANDRHGHFEEVLFPSPEDPSKQERVKLSSWMRHTDGSMFRYKNYLLGERRRSNPDPLVGMPGRSPYAACADRKAAIRMDGLRRLPIRSTTKSVEVVYTLHAKGVVIGTVSSGFQGSAFVQSVDDSFAQDRTSATIPEKLWRTLVADRALGGGPAPEWYGDSCLRCLQIENCQPNELFTISMPEQRRHRLLWYHEPELYPEDVLEFQNRVDAVTYNKRAFDGDSVNVNQEKLFGIGPWEVKVGDKICILFGCSVPVLLRPTEDVDENECFRCLGETFVYNMMNGEALEGLTDDQVKEFAIV